MKFEEFQEGKYRENDVEEFVPSDEQLDEIKNKYLPDWDMRDHRELHAMYVCQDHQEAEEMIVFINELSEDMDHFAEVTQDVAEVTVKTSTFDVKGLTILDFQLAMSVDAYAGEKGIKQVPTSGNFGMHEDATEEDNFTIDDIKNLEKVRDLETMKAQAKKLIKGKPVRRMKPEKISYFYDRVDSLTSPMKVIKLMYDLLLAGEGHKVIGSRNSMGANAYRQRFGDSIENDDTMMDEETKKDACYHKVKARYKVWPSAYASGALVQCRKKGAKNWGNKSK